MTASTRMPGDWRARPRRLATILGGASVLAVLTGASMSPALAAAGHAAGARHLGAYVPGSAKRAENMVYNGGPVQHHPKVYFVYWGSQWNSDPAGVKPYMTNLFQGLGTSTDTWSRITSQYKDSSGSGPVFSGAVYAASW